MWRVKEEIKLIMVWRFWNVKIKHDTVVSFCTKSCHGNVFKIMKSFQKNVFFWFFYNISRTKVATTVGLMAFNWQYIYLKLSSFKCCLYLTVYEIPSHIASKCVMYIMGLIACALENENETVNRWAWLAWCVPPSRMTRLGMHSCLYIL